MTVPNPPVARNDQTPAAARMARTRDRRRNKLLFVSVEIRESERSALVRQRLLEPGSENDPAAVARALYHLFDWIFRDA